MWMLFKITPFFFDPLFFIFSFSFLYNLTHTCWWLWKLHSNFNLFRKLQTEFSSSQVSCRYISTGTTSSCWKPNLSFLPKPSSCIIFSINGIPIKVIGEGKGNPPQSSCRGNPVDRRAVRAIVHSLGSWRVRHDLVTKQQQYQSNPPN